MPHTNILCFLLPLMAIAQTFEKSQMDKELFICYGKIDPIAVQGYKLVIIESQHYGADDIATLKLHNDKVLGYISLTEVNKTSSSYDDLAPCTVGKNEHWNSCYIDISNTKVQNILLSVIEKIINKGFDGLFLDNIDNTGPWGKLTSSKNDLVNFVKKIRSRYKKLFLMQNSGLFLAQEIKNTVDAILVESVLTAYDFEQEKYALRDDLSKKNMLQAIAEAKINFRKPIFIVEYVGEPQMKQQIEKELIRMGHPYFIANIDLQSEPQFLKN